MSALYANENYVCKGQSKENGQIVYGNYLQMIIDSEERAYIYTFPEHANTGNHAYTPEPVEVHKGTVHRDTTLTDFNGDSIYEGQIVEIPNGQRGKVVCCCATWGVALTGQTKKYGSIDWETLGEIVNMDSRGNYPKFMYNDNFISFYELFENFCPEDAIDSRCSAVCIVSDYAENMQDYHQSYHGDELPYRGWMYTILTREGQIRFCGDGYETESDAIEEAELIVERSVNYRRPCGA